MMKGITPPGCPPRAPSDEPTHWLVKPETLEGIWVVFGIILAGLVAGDLVVHHHEHFGIDGVFGFYAWYGFGSCVLMVVGAKLLGVVLKRPDTYYRDGDEPAPGQEPRDEAAEGTEREERA